MTGGEWIGYYLLYNNKININIHKAYIRDFISLKITEIEVLRDLVN